MMGYNDLRIHTELDDIPTIIGGQVTKQYKCCSYISQLISYPPL